MEGGRHHTDIEGAMPGIIELLKRSFNKDRVQFFYSKGPGGRMSRGGRGATRIYEAHEGEKVGFLGKQNGKI